MVLYSIDSNIYVNFGFDIIILMNIQIIFTKNNKKT